MDLIAPKSQEYIQLLVMSSVYWKHFDVIVASMYSEQAVESGRTNEGYLTKFK